MDMVGRGYTRADDGINTLLDERARASDAEPGVCPGEGGKDDSKGCKRGAKHVCNCNRTALAGIL